MSSCLLFEEMERSLSAWYQGLPPALLDVPVPLGGGRWFSVMVEVGLEVYGGRSSE